MMDTNNRATDLLQVFGLTTKEATIYQALLKEPWLTVVTLAQRLDIPRPTLYRLLSELERKGFIEKNIDHKTTYYATTPLSTFQNKVIESKKQTQQLESTISELTSLLSSPLKEEGSQTTVSFFRGVHGLRAMEWQVVEESVREVCVFGTALWWKYLGQDFAEEVRRERLKKKSSIREILNFENRSDPQDSWTEVKEYLKLYSDRYISREILPIDNEILITEKSVFLYNFSESELVGIRLVSTAYAKTLQALFEIVWGMAVE